MMGLETSQPVNGILGQRSERIRGRRGQVLSTQKPFSPTTPRVPRERGGHQAIRVEGEESGARRGKVV
jgi:hypothetical protein